MLFGLISLWRMKFQCRDFMAAMSCLKIPSASFSVNFFLSRMRSSNVPPSQYSYTRQTQLFVLIIYTNLTTFILFSRTLRVSISLRVSYASLPTSMNLSSATILTATFMRVSMWQARQTLPYSPLPRQEVSVQLSTIFTMAVSPLILYNSLSTHLFMIQLVSILVILAIVEYACAQEIIPEAVPAAAPGLKYYVFSQQCFDTFFVRNDWFNAECLKKTLVKILGYCIIVGASIVKVPQIVKIVKKKSTFGISFASTVLEAFTQMSAVAYNISRGNPFSVYGQTLLIAIQCLLILLLFIIYANKEEGGNKSIYIGALIVAIGCLYSALNPEYFPTYIIENAMVAQIILFSGSRILQIIQIHKVKSTGSLSEITCSLVVLGNISRLATAFVEVADDLLYRYSVINALALNGYILLSFLIFKPKAKVETKKE